MLCCMKHEYMLCWLQALQCLVNILRSLVEWYTAGMPAGQPEPRVTSASANEDAVQSWENLTSSGPSQIYGDGPQEDGAEPPSPLRPTLRRDTSVLQSMMMSTGTLVHFFLLNQGIHCYSITLRPTHSKYGCSNPLHDGMCKFIWLTTCPDCTFKKSLGAAAARVEFSHQHACTA